MGDPEAYLKFLEGAAHYVESVSHIREQLVEKGWTPGGAEAAAIQIIGMSVAANARGRG
ncbi:zinc finger FYVE domain-containing protein 21-like [Microbacterium sp. HM58-2]|nr:zinc finger FYVE domain-containing protein 21-like [Microbacterium sp. HM58-2]